SSSDLSCAVRPASPPRRPGRRRRWNAPPATRSRSGSAGTACPSPDSLALAAPEPLQVGPEAPFLEQLFSKLQPHHRLAQFGPGTYQLPFGWITGSFLQARLRPGEVCSSPRLELGRGNLNLPTDLPKILPLQQ